MGFPLHQTRRWHGYRGALSRVYRGAGTGPGGEDPRRGAATPIPSPSGPVSPCEGATGLCYVSSLKSQVQEDPGARRGGEEFSPWCSGWGQGLGVGVGGSPMAPLAPWAGPRPPASSPSFAAELMAGSPQEHSDTHSLKRVPKPLTQEAAQ